MSFLDAAATASANTAWRQCRARVLFALSDTALRKGQQQVAWTCLTEATEADSRHVPAHWMLANLSLTAGDTARAEALLRQILAVDPDHAGALGNLGSVLNDRGLASEAEALWQRALVLQPEAAPVAFNLGLLRVTQKRWDEAVVLLRQSLQRAPRQADAQYWLGNALMGAGHASEARDAYEQAVKLDGAYAQARWGKAMASLPAIALTAAEQQDAPAVFRSELIKLRSWLRAQRPGDAVKAVGAQQPYYIAYIEQDHRRVLSEYGALCNAALEQWPSRPKAPAQVRQTGDKFKLAIVSAHVHDHSVWHAIVRGWVEHLDPQTFELTLCHTGGGEDEQTRWARQRSARFVSGVGGWEAWSREIADGRFDGVIYPEIGMDATAIRLASQRLAPLQAASWGHPITTGLPSVDMYFSADAMEPSKAQQHYTERLVRLPGIGCCYQAYGNPAVASIDCARWGIGEQDRILICPGVPNKYAPRDDAVWVEIARRCAPCKLVFFKPPESGLGELLASRLKRAFVAAGVSFEDSVRFIPWLPRGAFFALLDRAEAMLDTIGFSGFNTAMQALERQTPVVAWEGSFLRGRLASGPLRAAGLGDEVVNDQAGYVSCVERLCKDREFSDQVRHRIAGHRVSLYEQVESVAALGAELMKSVGARS